MIVNAPRRRITGRDGALDWRDGDGYLAIYTMNIVHPGFLLGGSRRGLDCSGKYLLCPGLVIWNNDCAYNDPSHQPAALQGCKYLRYGIASLASPPSRIEELEITQRSCQVIRTLVGPRLPVLHILATPHYHEARVPCEGFPVLVYNFRVVDQLEMCDLGEEWECEIGLRGREKVFDAAVKPFQGSSFMSRISRLRTELSKNEIREDLTNHRLTRHATNLSVAVLGGSQISKIALPISGGSVGITIEWMAVGVEDISADLSVDSFQLRQPKSWWWELRAKSDVPRVTLLFDLNPESNALTQRPPNSNVGLPTVPSTGTAVKKAAVFPRFSTRDGTGRQKGGRKRGRDGSDLEAGQNSCLTHSFCHWRHSLLLQENTFRASDSSTAVNGRRPRPVNVFWPRLDGTGRHAVYGTRPTRKDGDGGQSYSHDPLQTHGEWSEGTNSATVSKHTDEI
ncbi:hypothetical protein DFH09DRAFT_1405611 [Mycena vulgaris]|nr:hypothetical protein DFH09DRAFT_1405611 [Mycena vulgaris]